MNKKQLNFLKQCKNYVSTFYANLESNKIFLFGTGARAKLIFSIFEELGRKNDVLGFIDNDTTKQGHKLYEKNIYGVNEVLEKYQEFDTIICSDRYRTQIEKQLDDNGIPYISHDQWITMM